MAPNAIAASPARTSSTIATLGEALAVGRHELGEFGQQLTGEVVDDGVAEVLEELGRRGLPAAGQAADDHDLRVRARPRAVRADLRSPGHRPVRLMYTAVSS